ncbi:BZ3501_MvSof-1269-A2-R1_C32g00109 [Microbotryum saponariae]|nr:BZ3501_MvSof-1269-A2-R1_C32g00109 [Microbotryum saponariae]
MYVKRAESVARLLETRVRCPAPKHPTLQSRKVSSKSQTARQVSSGLLKQLKTPIWLDPPKKVAIVPAKKVPTIPRSQTKQASGAVITTESTNGAVATTLPTGSVFDASESCPRAAAAPGVTVSNKVSAVAATSFKKASTSPLPSSRTPPKPTIKCLLPSTADQNRSKPPAVELPVRRPTVRFARTEVFSTADGRSTTVSAKGDFLGVWVPKH